MKVTNIETLLIDNVPNYRGGRKWLFIKLATDEGIVGLGDRVRGNSPKRYLGRQSPSPDWRRFKQAADSSLSSPVVT